MDLLGSAADVAQAEAQAQESHNHTHMRTRTRTPKSHLRLAPQYGCAEKQNWLSTTG